MAPESFKQQNWPRRARAASGRIRVSERHGKESGGNAAPTRSLVRIVALFAALLVSLTLTAAASANVSFTRAYGWGVSDGASRFETCTSTCQLGIGGGGAGQLNYPGFVATDSSGDVYVADSANQRIDEFSAGGAFIKAYGWGVLDGASQFETCTSTCEAGNSPVGGAGAGGFVNPEGVATDSSGDVYVADAGSEGFDVFPDERIDEFSAAGSFIKAYGWGVLDGADRFETCTSSCQPGIAGGGAGQLEFATGVATDSSGDVYVADDGLGRIDEFSAAGAFIKAYGWGVSDGASQFETCTSTCEGGVGGAGVGQLDYPDGVATDSSGDVYVADFDTERIDEFSAAGAFIKAYGWGVSDGASQFETCTSTCQQGIAGGGAGQLYAPTGVATDPSGDVYVAGGGNDARIDEFSGSVAAPGPPAVAPSPPTVCGGTSSSAAYTALAAARSDTQCSTELADEGLSAESTAEYAGWLCHSKPKGVVAEYANSLVQFICHWDGLIATSDYKAWADGSPAGTPLPFERARGIQARVQNALPTTNFGAVFRPRPIAVPGLRGMCPRLRAVSCNRLKVAELGYLKALAHVASLSEAVGVTANRFAGAKDAGDIYAESLQSVAEAKYLPLQASAVRGLRQAGRRLGTVLKRDRINTVFTAKQVAQGRKQLSKLDGIPGSLITRLERDGLITNRKDLERIIAALLKTAPRARATTLAQVFEM
jgi:hypothetical protein